MSGRLRSMSATAGGNSALLARSSARWPVGALDVVKPFMRRMSVMVRNICASSSTTRTRSWLGEEFIEQLDQAPRRKWLEQAGMNERALHQLGLIGAARLPVAQDQRNARIHVSNRHDGVVGRDSIEPQIENDHWRRFLLEHLQSVVETLGE